MPATAKKYVVKKGDTLTKICKQYEIRDWKKLWNHKDNKSLNRKYNGNEAAIQPKDVLLIPPELSPKLSVISVEIGGKTYEFKTERERDAFLKTVKMIEYKGKKLVFVGDEWDKFQKDMCTELRRTAVLAANQRAMGAETLWEIFNEINNDQYIVAWFVSLGGPKLPNKALILAAKSAAKDLESAVSSGDFKRIHSALGAAEKPINTAYEAMQKYQQEVTGRAGTWVEGLKITKTASFTVVGILAVPVVGPVAGSTALGAAVAGGGTALVQSTANELGHGLAGSSRGVGDALANIARDTITDATVGLILKSARGKAIVEKAGKLLAQRLAGKAIARVSNVAVQKYLTMYLNNAGQSAMEEAIKQTGKLVTGKTKAEDFIANVAQSAVLGGVLKQLDKAIDERYARSVYDRLPKQARDEFFRNVKDPEKVVATAMKKFASLSAGQALDAALATSSGKETPEQVVDKAADRLVKDQDFLEKVKAAAQSQ